MASDNLKQTDAGDAKACLWALAVVLVGACSSEPDRGSESTAKVAIPEVAGSAALAAGDDERDCLLVVWERQESPDREFDRAHDLAEGGLISCATGTSASQYEATLAAIRAAASGDDSSALLGEVDVPLLFIDDDGSRVEIADADLASGRFREIFSPDVVALLRDLQLADMTIVPDEGGFFELGAIWLRPAEPGGRPQVVTINRQALQEAAAADRRNTGPRAAATAG